MTIVLLRAVAGILLIAHGLVHLLYLVDDVPEFSLDRSWLVPEAASRPVAHVLMTATIVTSVALGLAVWGVPVIQTIWPLATVAAVATSLALLLSFWHNRLVFGVTINLVLLAVVVLRPEWTQHLGA